MGCRRTWGQVRKEAEGFEAAGSLATGGGRRRNFVITGSRGGLNVGQCGSGLPGDLGTDGGGIVEDIGIADLQYAVTHAQDTHARSRSWQASAGRSIRTASQARMLHGLTGHLPLDLSPPHSNIFVPSPIAIVQPLMPLLPPRRVFGNPGGKACPEPGDFVLKRDGVSRHLVVCGTRGG